MNTKTAAEGSLVEEVETGAGAEGAEGAGNEGQNKEGEGDPPAGGEGAEGEKKEAATEAQGTVPDSADKYDFTISADIGLKDEKGDPFQFAPDDPLIAEARDAAFKHKISQEALSDLLAIYARANLDGVKEASEAAAAAEEARKTEELSKLKFTGADGKEVDGAQRINTMLNNVNRILNDDGASKLLKDGLINAGVVQVVDRLVAKLLEKPSGKEGSGASNKFEGLRGAKLLEAIRAEG